MFSSPLLAHVWSDVPRLNVSLKQAILDHAQKHPGEERTNLGGWHSETAALEFCGKAGEELIGHMRTMTEEATLASTRNSHVRASH